MEKICMYLRKSRADEEAEKRGEGETLSKHRKILLQTAKKLNLNIVKIREEIVSGESLMHRPEMLELLKEVEKSIYDAVLVMDMDRLGRGNMQEQGLILETFKKSRTKIITPRKTYDLEDEFDEEYSEFEAFMARKELKIINRRLQRGRIRSVEDGNYISPNPPYGYIIHETKDFRTLRPHPQQAPIVKMVFDLYVNKGLGGGKIANRLNELGYTTYTGKKWHNSSVLIIIKNPVYKGKVIWKKKEIKKSNNPNKVKDTKTRPIEEWIIADGKHEALISEELFDKAQRILNKRTHVPYNTKIINPLAGIIKCGICSRNMVYREYSHAAPRILCYNSLCSNKSTRFEYVEEKILEGLNEWLNKYKIKWNDEYINAASDDNSMIDIFMKTHNKLKNELEELSKQKGNLHDLLERGIYNVDTYLDRSQILIERIDSTNQSIEKVLKDIEMEKQKNLAQKNIIPKVEKVLDIYPKTKSSYKKNKLLKSILEKAVYTRFPNQKSNEFTLDLYPKLTK